METALLGLAGVLLLLGAVEVVLRRQYGLGTPPLYLADVRTGYRLAPNQSLRWQGNRIDINRYSMRGGEVSPQRPAETLRVLMLGDSIVNGGWWTDQQHIPFLDFLPLFQPEDYPPLYRDHIHLSPRGNELVGKTLARFICQNLEATPKPREARPDDVLRDLW